MVDRMIGIHSGVVMHGVLKGNLCRIKPRSHSGEAGFSQNPHAPPHEGCRYY